MSTSKCKISGLFKEIAMKKTMKLFRWNLLFFICIGIYDVIYTGNIYGVNYTENNTTQAVKNHALLITSLFILSNPHLYKRTENRLWENLQIKLALRCEG